MLLPWRSNLILILLLLVLAGKVEASEFKTIYGFGVLTCSTLSTLPMISVFESLRHLHTNSSAVESATKACVGSMVSQALGLVLAMILGFFPGEIGITWGVAVLIQMTGISVILGLYTDVVLLANHVFLGASIVNGVLQLAPHIAALIMLIADRVASREPLLDHLPVF